MRHACLLSLLFPVLLLAQKENMHWHFGYNASIEFVDGVPRAKTGSALYTVEGCATMSDSNGNLLFYTNGMEIWNRNHQVMQNGSGLLGDNSSSQSALIVRKPGSTYLYYIITANGRSGNPGLGAYYTEVDMRLDNGRGGVSAFMNVKLQDSSDEKLAAVRHSNGRDIWILIPEYSSDAINSYLLTSSGFSGTPVRSTSGLNGNGTTGYIKVSPNGKHLAICAGWGYQTDRVLLAGFNSSNGTIQNPYSFEMGNTYGLEFSPNSRFLYIGANKMYQLDMEAGSPAQIETSMLNLNPSGGISFGGMQLGPNGKIYFTVPFKNYLGSIEYPDMYGVACGLRLNSVNLGSNTAVGGLQNQMALPFKPPSVSMRKAILDCRIQIDFTLHDYWDKDDVRWFFGDSLTDSTGNSGLGLSTRHVYTASAKYNAWVEYRISGNQWKRLFIKIDLREPGLRNVPRCLKDSIGICPGETKLLGCYIPGAYAYRWVDETRSYSGMQYAASLPQRLKYYFTDSNACRYTDSIVVFSYNPKTELGTDTAICVNDSIWLKDLTGKTFRKYRWGNGDTASVCLALPGSTISLETTDQNGCISADTVFVAEKPLPVLPRLSDTSLCEGDTLFLFLNRPDQTYSLNGSSVSGKLKILGTGSYVLESQRSGCVLKQSMRLLYRKYPETELGLTDTVCFSRSHILIAGEAEHYRWSTGATSRSISVNSPGTYTVWAYNGPCAVTDSIQLLSVVNPVFVPNAFTPGGDALNNVYSVSESSQILEMRIYNRWGQQVFYSTDVKTYWDGTSEGKNCQQDVYLLMLSYRDCAGRVSYLKENIHLLR